MKIVVTSTGPTLDDQVDSRFGRCPYHLFVETDDMSFEAAENPNVDVKGCAGHPTAKLLSKKEVKVILTGNCGPGHKQELENLGIEVILGTSGTARQAVEQFKQVRAAMQRLKADEAAASS